MLEVGFHAEHPKVDGNEAVLNRLFDDEHLWRRELGGDPEAGVFIGVDRWRRISEIWEETDPDDVSVLEPLRRA